MVKICQTGLLKLNFETRPKKRIFRFLPKIFRRPRMKLKIFFCQFPNPWDLRVSGMGGYTSKCEKKSKSLHPSTHATSSTQRYQSQTVIVLLLTIILHTEGNFKNLLVLKCTRMLRAYGSSHSTLLLYLFVLWWNF
jgi:hypothetical protein